MSAWTALLALKLVHWKRGFLCMITYEYLYTTEAPVVLVIKEYSAVSQAQPKLGKICQSRLKQGLFGFELGSYFFTGGVGMFTCNGMSSSTRSARSLDTLLHMKEHRENLMTVFSIPWYQKQHIYQESRDSHR